MASIDAINAAKEVINRIDKGEKVVMAEILENIGYAKNTADNPKLVTETDSYKSVMNKFTEKLEKEITRIQDELALKDLSEERYKDLVDSLDKLNKNLQLATGGDTERRSVTVIFDEAFKERT